MLRTKDRTWGVQSSNALAIIPATSMPVLTPMPAGNPYMNLGGTTTPPPPPMPYQNSGFFNSASSTNNNNYNYSNNTSSNMQNTFAGFLIKGGSSNSLHNQGNTNNISSNNNSSNAIINGIISSSNNNNMNFQYNMNQSKSQGNLTTGKKVRRRLPSKGIPLERLELPARLVNQKEVFNEASGWLSAQREKSTLYYSQMQSQHPTSTPPFHYQSQQLLSYQQQQQSFSSLSTSKIRLTSIQSQPTNNSFQLHQQQQQQQQSQQQQLQASSFADQSQLQQQQQRRSTAKKPIFYERKNIFRVKHFMPLPGSTSLYQSNSYSMQPASSMFPFLPTAAASTYGGSMMASQNDDPIALAVRRSLLHDFEMKVSQFIKTLTIKKELGSKQQHRIYKRVEQSIEELNGNSSFAAAAAGAAGSGSIAAAGFEPTSRTAQNQRGSVSDSTYNLINNMSLTSNNNNNNMHTNNNVTSAIGMNGGYIGSATDQMLGSTTSMIEPSSRIVQADHSTYKTYYQMNEQQFEELSPRQVKQMSEEDRHMYLMALEQFRLIGNRFQVKVYGRGAQATDSTAFVGEDNNNSVAVNDETGGMQGKEGGRLGSDAQVHEALQEMIIERCRKYLLSGHTDYDEKLRVMRAQYERMLVNFEVKSFRIYLPENVRVRGQTFNDFYIVDKENAKQVSQTRFLYPKLKDLENIVDENFANIQRIAIQQETEARRVSELQELEERRKANDLWEESEIFKSTTSKNPKKANNNKQKRESRTPAPIIGMLDLEQLEQQQQQPQQTLNSIEEDDSPRHNHTSGRTTKKRTQHSIPSVSEDDHSDEQDSVADIQDQQNTPKKYTNQPRMSTRKSQPNVVFSSRQSNGQVVPAAPVPLIPVAPADPVESQQEQPSSTPGREQKVPQLRDAPPQQTIKVEEVEVNAENDTGIVEEKKEEVIVVNSEQEQQVESRKKGPDVPLISMDEGQVKKQRLSSQLVNLKGIEVVYESGEDVDSEIESSRQIVRNSTTEDTVIDTSSKKKITNLTEGSEVVSVRQEPALISSTNSLPEVILLGTGFLDQLLDCEDLMRFDVDQFVGVPRRTKRRSVALDAHVHHATEEDEKVFKKLAKWEVEEEIINESYKKFHQKLINSIIMKAPKNRVKKEIIFEDEEGLFGDENLAGTSESQRRIQGAKLLNENEEQNNQSSESDFSDDSV